MLGCYLTLRPHLHFTLLANARKRLRYAVLSNEQPSQLSLWLDIGLPLFIIAVGELRRDKLASMHVNFRSTQSPPGQSFWMDFPLVVHCVKTHSKIIMLFMRRIIIYHYWLSVSYLRNRKIPSSFSEYLI